MTKEEIIPSRTDVLSMAREADREWDCDRDMVEWLEWFAALIASRVAAASASVERKVIMDSLQKQADLATDALDRRWALEMIAAVAARSNT